MSKPGDTDDEIAAARVEERKRIARDVHDELGGDLAAIKMALAVLGRRLPDEQGLREQFAYVDTLVDGAIDSMHRVADKWQDLPETTLQEAVARQVAEFSRQSGLACQAELPDTLLGMDRSASALARMLRECLTNIGKHAQPSRVRVGLRLAGHGLILEVEDDGVGMPADLSAATKQREGQGIRGMQERAAELGGDFSIRAASPRGTLVVIELPLGNVRA